MASEIHSPSATGQKKAPYAKLLIWAILGRPLEEKTAGTNEHTHLDLFDNPVSLCPCSLSGFVLQHRGDSGRSQRLPVHGGRAAPA